MVCCSTYLFKAGQMGKSLVRKEEEMRRERCYGTYFQRGIAPCRRHALMISANSERCGPGAIFTRWEDDKNPKLASASDANATRSLAATDAVQAERGIVQRCASCNSDLQQFFSGVLCVSALRPYINCVPGVF